MPISHASAIPCSGLFFLIALFNTFKALSTLNGVYLLLTSTVSLNDLKSGYTKSPFENTCDKCKLNIIPNEKAKSFRTVNTVNDDDFPLCFQNTKINKKCCTIKEEDTYFGCPKYCFDSIRENIKNIKPSTEDDYKYIMKENSYCNSF